MNILISTNDNYKVPTMVMLTSLLASAGTKTACGEQGGGPDVPVIYLLESELSEAADAGIRALVESKGASYVRIHVSGDDFAESKTKPYISRETYYRLLAPGLLPGEADRVLWLDSDVIVRKDLRSFYETDLGDCMAAACGYGPAMSGLIGEHARSLGLARPETYFNAGVMLMNLRACREGISGERLRGLAASERTAEFMFPGQDVVNILFDGRVKLMDYRIWNCMTHSITDSGDLAAAEKDAAVVHFAGEAKPWKFNDIHFAGEWMEWYKACFGDGADLRRMSYFRLKALFSRGR